MGSKFLKVTGILMIIFGAISLVVSIIAILGLGVLEALGAPMGLLWASGIISLVGSVDKLPIDDPLVQVLAKSAVYK